jgi:L-2-hydroxyglutarate oxidase LhgO
MYDVLIIGCGVVGAAAARELSKYDLKTAVLEAQNDVAMGASKANSAIIHAGYDPKAGSQMAALNILGNKLTGELCAKLDVPFKRIGSLVLAFDENDLKPFRRYTRAACRAALKVWLFGTGRSALRKSPISHRKLPARCMRPPQASSARGNLRLRLRRARSKTALNYF